MPQHQAPVTGLNSLTNGKFDVLSIILIGGGYTGTALSVLDPGAWMQKIPALFGAFFSLTITIIGVTRWYNFNRKST